MCFFWGIVHNNMVMCLDVNERVYVSRHVRFHEHVYRFADKLGQFISSATLSNTCIPTPLFLPFSFENNSPDNLISFFFLSYTTLA